MTVAESFPRPSKIGVAMDTIAVVLRQPEQIELNRLALTAPTPDDVVVDVDWSGVSTGEMNIRNA